MACRSFLAILVAIVAWTSTVSAQEREYDPRALTRTEIQMIQDALIWTSTYVGLKDGNWGQMTAEALRNWRRANSLRTSETFNEAELTLLFHQSIQARAAVGWTMLREPHTGAWMGYPGRFLKPADRKNLRPDIFLVNFEGADTGLSMAAVRTAMSLARLREFISAMAGEADVAAVAYRLDREHRQVISFDKRDGSTAYLRLDRVGAESVGFMVIVSKNRRDLSRVITAISAEFSATGSSVIEKPTDAPVIGPVIAHLTAQPPAASVPSMPQMPVAAAPSRPAPTPRAEAVVGSGTAFAVRTDGMFLTNQHVIDGCTRLAFADGTRLTVVRADAHRDLALLRATGLPTTNIVRFRRDPTIDLGETVSLFGFPLYGAISTSLNITNGIVTSLVGIGDNPMHFQINAAMQPGNSGGPLFDEAGLVIGVGVARLSDKAVMRATGTLPQTMNYAIRGQVVDAFLLENGVLSEKAPAQRRADLREVAQQMQTAVRAVLCYE